MTVDGNDDRSLSCHAGLWSGAQRWKARARRGQDVPLEGGTQERQAALSQEEVKEWQERDPSPAWHNGCWKPAAGRKP